MFAVVTLAMAARQREGSATLDGGKQNPLEGFEAFVMFIRENGYREKYEGYWYIKFDIDGWSYWTVGAPLKETILINRRKAD